jgi:hypothetical protein
MISSGLFIVILFLCSLNGVTLCTIEHIVIIVELPVYFKSFYQITKNNLQLKCNEI